MKREELNHENFEIFILGYDILQSELNKRNLDVDTAFEVCSHIYGDFLVSSYNVIDKSEYECMQNFINNQDDNYIDKILENYYTSTNNIKKSDQVIYIISGWTEDNNCTEVWRNESIWIDTPDEKNWENIIGQFNYYCNRAMSLGYYGGYDWCVSIRRLKLYNNGSVMPETLILKMTKKLYKDFKNIIEYPITPSFNENLTALDDEDKDVKYELVNWRDELYYDSRGFAPQFKTCAEAWEYIFQNDLIS